MDSISAAALKQEMEDMAVLLREIQGGARDLYDPSTEKRILESKRLSSDQKREKSTSAWAKSSVNRSKLFTTNKSIDPESTSTADVEKSEKTLKTRAASHSFGRRYDARKAEVENFIYDVNIEAASTRKRVLSTKFSMARREGSSVKNKDNDNPNNNPNNNSYGNHNSNSNNNQNGQMGIAIDGNQTEGNDVIDDNQSDNIESNKVTNKSAKRNKTEYNPYGKQSTSSHLEPSAIAFSFPKSSRETKINKYESDAIGSNLDVESAEKKLHPHVMGACMKPLSAVGRAHSQIDPEAPPVDRENKNSINPTNPTNSTPIIKPEVLSHKFRAPVFSMHQDTKRKPHMVIMEKDKVTPGPGDYCSDRMTQSDVKGGKLYHDRSTVTKAFLLGEAMAPKGNTPGPGDYEVASSESYLRHIPHTTKFSASDPKSTPQLEKKKYWEEKARDAREEYDDMGELNDSVLRSRVPSAVMVSGEFKGDEKQKRILRERLKARSTDAQGRTYDVNHSLVEKRSLSTVGMAQEILVKESMRHRLLEKPLVARVQAERLLEVRGADKFYGPNLPVAWGEELPRRGGDDGEDSPTKEILQFLGSRNQNNKTNENIISETAGHFLRSSYSGGGVGLKSKANMMREEGVNNMRGSLLGVKGDKDYLGPQLQVDWLSNLESRTQGPVMKTHQGRDEKNILRKGMVEVKLFGDVEGSSMKVDDAIGTGPGMYDITRGRGIGDSPRGKGVPFSRAIPRDEQVGPYGEKPDYLKEDLALALDESYLQSHYLDHDYGDAKDENEKHPVRTFELYKKERHPVPKGVEYLAQERLGGTWFEGLAEGVEKHRATVQISKMTGRTDDEADSDLQEERGLDLQVVDYNPGMRQQENTVFADPIRNPRWEEKGEEDEELHPLSPKYTTQRKTEYVLNMDKQSGREQIISGVKKDDRGYDLMEEVYGVEDREAGNVLQGDVEDAVERGTFFTSKSRRVHTVDMSQQGERTKQEVQRVDEMGNVLDEKNVLELDLDKYDDKAWIRKTPGVHDWGKQLGREDLSSQHSDPTDPLLHGEKLIIEPTDGTTSKYKREISGPHWGLNKTPRPGGQDLIEREIKESEEGKMNTEYEVKTGREIDWKNEAKGDVPWEKNVPRQTQASLLMKEYLQLDPLLDGGEGGLDLKPEHTAQSKYERIKVGPHWSSSQKPPHRNNKILKESGIIEEKDNLILQVERSFQDKRVLGGSMSGTDLYASGGNYEIKEKDLKNGKLEGMLENTDGNTLHLDVNDDFQFDKIKGGSPMGILSLGPKGGKGGKGGLGGNGVSQSHIGLSEMQDELIRSGEINNSNPPLELVLVPDDIASRKRVPGGSAMGFTPQSGPGVGLGFGVRSSGDLSRSASGRYLVSDARGMGMYSDPKGDNGKNGSSDSADFGNGGNNGNGSNVLHSNKNKNDNNNNNDIDIDSNVRNINSKDNKKNDINNNNNINNKSDIAANDDNNDKNKSKDISTNKNSPIVTDIAQGIKNQKIASELDRSENQKEKVETKNDETTRDDTTTQTFQGGRKKDDKKDVNMDGTAGNILKNFIRVRFSADLDTDKNNENKNEKYLQKSGKSDKNDKNDFKNNEKSSKNNKNNKNDKLQSSSSIMAGVSSSIKAKKEKEYENEKETKGTKPTDSNPPKDIKNKKNRENPESDSSSYPSSDPRSDPIEAPRLSAPPMGTHGPPSFSPNRINTLGEKLKNMDIK